MVHSAIRNRNQNALAAILQVGASVNRLSPHMGLPLHHAARLNFVEGINLLLRAGADPFQNDEHSNTALAVARHARSFQAADLLTRVCAVFAGDATQIKRGLLRTKRSTVHLVVLRVRVANPRFSNFARCGSCQAVISVESAGARAHVYHLIHVACGRCGQGLLVEPPFVLHRVLQTYSSPLKPYTRRVTGVDAVETFFSDRPNNGVPSSPTEALVVARDRRFTLHVDLGSRAAKDAFVAAMHNPARTPPPVQRPTASTQQAPTHQSPSTAGAATTAARPPPPPPRAPAPAPTSLAETHAEAQRRARAQAEEQARLQGDARRPSAYEGVRAPGAGGATAVPPPPYFHASDPPPAPEPAPAPAPAPVPEFAPTTVQAPAPSPAAPEPSAAAVQTLTPAPAPAPAASEDDECVVCMDSAKEALCVPCGHQCGCLECLEGIKQSGGGCPICRTPVQQVVRVYRS